jgi:hypothetical protein
VTHRHKASPSIDHPWHPALLHAFFRFYLLTYPAPSFPTATVYMKSMQIASLLVLALFAGAAMAQSE